MIGKQFGGGVTGGSPVDGGVDATKCGAGGRLSPSKLLIAHCTLPAHSVQRGFAHVHFKAVGGFQCAHQAFGLLRLHVEDFPAFGARKVDVALAGGIVEKLVERLAATRFAHALDFLLCFKFGQVSVDGTFAYIFARKCLRDFFGRKGFVGIFGEKSEQCCALFGVVCHTPLQFATDSQIV